MIRKIGIPAGITFFLLTLAFTCTAHAKKALPDFPYLSQLANYNLKVSNDREFDEFSFFDGKQMVTIQGRKYTKNYFLNPGALSASPLQITKNYANAVKAQGGEVLYEGKANAAGMKNKSGDRLASLKMVKEGKEIWIEIISYDRGHRYQLNAIEKGEMKQEVSVTTPQPEAPKPEAKPEPPKEDLAREIKSKGFATIYVNFDVDKATIKPESQPTIDHVAQMLKDNPDLNLTIAGHTDGSGTMAHNKTLSENRAQAVLQALVGRGIATDRLASVGFGQEKPIADNATEAGKAKNRRVELIKK
ncbi:MAG: OmpA family protein [Syntrophales bacterium]|nr:OmpA family protein [Syntrophales bacterium]MDD5642514.1 OmpA family protein [Syntrophales bacterium]